MNIITSSAPLSCFHLESHSKKKIEIKKVRSSTVKFSHVTLKTNKIQKYDVYNFTSSSKQNNAQHEETPCRHLYSFTRTLISRSTRPYTK